MQNIADCLKEQGLADTVKVTTPVRIADGTLFGHPSLRSDSSQTASETRENPRPDAVWTPGTAFGQHTDSVRTILERLWTSMGRSAAFRTTVHPQFGQVLDLYGAPLASAHTSDSLFAEFSRCY